MQRIRTGLAMAVPAILLILFSPPLILEGLIGLLILGAAWEWSVLAGLRTRPMRTSFVLATALAMGLAAIAAGPGRSGLEPLLVVSGAGWVLAAIAVVIYPRGTAPWASVVGRALLGWFVLVPPWIAVLYLRAVPHGEVLLLFCIALIAFVDIGAFFAGRGIGGPKLMPEVSPAKTWSGFCGGMLASLGLAFVAALAADIPPDRMESWLFICLLTAVAAVVGDLLESMLKRHAGIKDSGSLLPGHGGLFDRLDSLTAGLPVFALGMLYSGGFTA